MRGRGYLAGLLLVLSFVFMIPAQELGKQFCQGMMLFWIVGCGVWVTGTGLIRLIRARAELGTSFGAFEWLVDVVFWKPRPFDSLMFIQMPWWGLAYAYAAYRVVLLLVRADAQN